MPIGVFPLPIKGEVKSAQYSNQKAITKPMHPPYYGHYYRRPSRLFWFFLGGAAVVIFQNKFKEGRSFGWWHDRRRVEDTPSDGTEPLWKLRGEKEKERREAEFHKDMDNARDKVRLS